MAWSKRRTAWGAPWLGLPLGGVLALSGAVHAFWSLEPSASPALTASASADDSAPGASAAASERPPDRTGQLSPGQTLGGLLSVLGVPNGTANQIARAAARFVDLRQLRAGAGWRVFLDAGGEIERFDLAVPRRGQLRIAFGAAGWQPEWRPFAREITRKTVHGDVQGSLEASIVRAGGPPELAYQVAEVFQWDLDFSRDLRRGDVFRVLYEEVRIEREAPRPERVLAVEYGHEGGRRLEGYFFGDDEQGGYYDAQGRPLQKMFLRSPLPYSRVTSGFSHRRFHPVLGVFRPHHGVDYGAPTGTPVRVTATGTVVSAGWDGGGGRTVKVRHSNGYLTAYLHLSKYASGVRAGARVRQGDVIGYVGSTGLATAPHLDYRVQVQGRWIDPLSLKSGAADPIPQARLAAFFGERDALQATLVDGLPHAAPSPQLAQSSAPATSAPAGRTAAGHRR